MGFSFSVISYQALNVRRVGYKICSHVFGKFFDKNVLGQLVQYFVTSLSISNKCFKYYPCVRYATDVTFQQSNRPSGSLEEGKEFYSGKHKLYGYKVEVSVLPIRLAIQCTDHFPGSVADINIFHKDMDFHKLALAKSDQEKGYSDMGRAQSILTNRHCLLIKGTKVQETDSEQFIQNGNLKMAH